MKRALAFLAVMVGLVAWFVSQVSIPLSPKEKAAQREAEWDSALNEYTEEEYIGSLAFYGMLNVEALDKFVEAPWLKQVEIAERLSRRATGDRDIRFDHGYPPEPYARFSPQFGLVLVSSE